MSNWNLKKINEYLKPIGYKCLSEVYVNRREKLEFCCQNGHRWFTTLRNFTENKSRCLECKKNQELEKIKDIALARGGKCLSSEYINTNYKMKWECRYGHKWIAAVHNIKYSSSWCPQCNKKKPIDLSNLRNLVEKRGGKLISQKVRNSKSKVMVECSNGHQWRTSQNSLRILYLVSTLLDLLFRREVSYSV